MVHPNLSKIYHHEVYAINVLFEKSGALYRTWHQLLETIGVSVEVNPQQSKSRVRQ